MASLLGPTTGGILAGAPIRASGVVFLQYLHQGIESATELTRGVVFAMIANVFFVFALYLSLPRFGLLGTFGDAGAVFIAANRNEAGGFNLGNLSTRGDDYTRRPVSARINRLVVSTTARSSYGT